MGTLATIKRQNGPTAASMHALQVRWYELATKERRWRTVQGGATTALGGALVAAAAVIAAIPNDMDPTVRALYSRMLLGSGVAGVGAGLSSLLIPSGIERGYSAFARSTRTPSFALTPLAGGAGLTLAASF